MCLAVPALVLELRDGAGALVDVAGVQREISLALTPEARQEDWVLVHVGFALAVIDQHEARETLAHRLVHEIERLVEPGVPVRIMEVCGGHTHAIDRHGLADLLPPEVELLHGPSCPVCVVPPGRIDDAVALAERPGITLATFGDVLRAPGKRRSLLDARASGGDVRIVRSPLDALGLARANRRREVVFLAVGFETAAPATAVTLLQAQRDGVDNFAVLCNHVTILPPLRAILGSPGTRIDAFIAPGHVATVTGTRLFEPIAREYGRPVVVSAFEPVDLLQSIAMILRQRAEGRCEVENQYGRGVCANGNPDALLALAAAFRLRDAFEWRGLGTITRSAFGIRPELARWDAEARHELPRAVGASAARHASRRRAASQPVSGT
jgi:hydrogenase expression/formation protein HypD